MRLGAAIPLLLGVGVVAGCGGGSGDRLTQEEFLQQGNAICAKGNQDIETAGASAFATPGEPTEAEVRAFGENVIFPNVEEMLDQLRALSPPKEDEEQVDQILDEAQAALDKVKADPALLAQNSGFDEADRLASAYGLTACAGEEEGS